MLRISLPLKSIDTPWKHVRKVSEFSMASVFSAHLLDLLKMDVFKLLSILKVASSIVVKAGKVKSSPNPVVMSKKASHDCWMYCHHDSNTCSYYSAVKTYI